MLEKHSQSPDEEEETACDGVEPWPPGAEEWEAGMEGLDDLIDATASLGRPASFREEAGHCLHHYKLVRRIGAGGMGDVWEAEQQHPAPQRVALKILKLGMNTRQVLARFEIEQRALAVLDHPHIARIFDGGSTDDGRPYFVMEFVDGDSITQFAEAYRLSIEDRLKLMTQACEAVQHAHHKGIIHRDLKPGNILVSMVDGKPLLKIIDFGIAKAVNESVRTTELLTQCQMVLGTMGYMSPEQTTMDQSQVGTRSDVYALGAILYELLTGELPFNLKTLGQMSQSEALVYVRDHTPKRPSARKSVSEGLFRNEIDWVVMRALEKDPERRYQSATALHEDLEALLTERPVQARRTSRLYIARKWAARNKAVVFASVAVMVITTVSVGVFKSLADAAIQKNEERGWVRRLVASSWEDGLKVIEERKVFSDSVVELLREEAGHNEIETRGGFLTSLALLLHGDGPAREAELWRLLEDFGADRERRFWAAAALARVAPEDSRWERLEEDVALWLAQRSSVVECLEYFRPLANRLRPMLEEDLFYRESIVERDNVAMVLGRFFAPDLEAMAELASLARPSQFPPFIEALKSHGQRGVDRLHEGFSEDFRLVEDSLEKDAQALRQSRLGLALVHLGRMDLLLPHLRMPQTMYDPRLRSFLIHGFADYGVSHQEVERLLGSSDPGLVMAGLLALGDYRLSETARSHLTAEVERLYTLHADPGVHSAAEWLLRHWHCRHVDLENPDAEPEWPEFPPQLDPKPGQRWYVTPSGVTMVVIPGPVEFTMGVPENEPGKALLDRRKPFVVQHQRRIPRAFAIATKEVTYALLERFQPGFMEKVRGTEQLMTRQTNLPHVTAHKAADGINFRVALRFCNWLSEQEGIPPDQWGFEVPDDTNQPVVFKEDFLSCSGYRLATEAEWEYACRAQATTSRYYGQADSLLSKYEWYVESSDVHAWRPGRLRPNAFGLFDMLGNLSEWVHGYYVPLALGEGNVIDDEAIVGLKPLPDRRNTYFSVRGGNYHTLGSGLRSGQRSFSTYPHGKMCLRLVRTIKQDK